MLGEKCIRDYYRRYYPFDQGRTLGLEQQIFITLDQRGDYKLVGYVDRLTQASDGTIEIHDYKTGQSLPTQEILDQDRQLALYQIGIHQRWPDIKSVKLVWHYLAFDREMSSQRTFASLQETKSQTIQLIDEIERAVDFAPRSNPLCPWCEFGDLCPLMKHLHKVEALPVHEYLHETGVNLVNRYAELAAKKSQMLEELETELNKLKQALIQYAEKEGVEIVYGSEHKIKIKAKDALKFPAKDDPRRQQLEQMIKEVGEWSKFSDLNLTLLSEAVQSNQLLPELKEKILKLAELEKSYRFYLSKGMQTG
jgi:putative RecB family exonuclease